MPVKGGQGKTIILYKDLINKSYTASFYINQDLSISILTISTNLIVVSRVQGHEIRIVLYAYLDGGNCQFY